MTDRVTLYLALLNQRVSYLRMLERCDAQLHAARLALQPADHTELDRLHEENPDGR